MAREDAEVPPKPNKGLFPRTFDPKDQIFGGTLQPYLSSTGHESLIPLNILSELGRGGLRKLLLNRPLSDLGYLEQIRSLWRNLIATARNKSVTDRHLTATCNVICVFIQNAFPRSDSDGQVLGAPSHVWFDCFNVISRTFGEGKTKPALQVLETLVQACRNIPDREVADSIWKQAVRSMLEIIVLEEPQKRMKEAVVVLTGLLRRNPEQVSELTELVARIVDDNRAAWTRRLTRHGIDPVDLSRFADPTLGSFLLSVFFARDIQEARNAAVKLFSSLVKTRMIEAGSRESPELEIAMELYLSGSTVNLDEFANDIFPAFFTDARQFDSYITTYKAPMARNRLALFLATLQVGRVGDYINDTELPSAVARALVNGSEGLDAGWEIFSLLLTHADPGIRSQSYRLLTWSSKTTTSIPFGVWNCVLIHQRYLHDEGDAHYRGNILSISSKFVGRIHGSSASLQKRDGAEAKLREYNHFLSHLVHFLVEELSPGVSYQRHIISLQMIVLLVASTPDCYNHSIVDPHTMVLENLPLLSNLVALLLDPFEDVRETSMKIFQRLFEIETKTIIKIDTNSPMMRLLKSPELITSFESLASASCRGDHADGLGRLYGINVSASTTERLVHRLESFLLPLSAFELPTKFPLHGILLGVIYRMVKSIVDQDLPRLMLAICSKIWILAQPQLCIDSPEFATEDVEEDSDVGPKDLLAYSWRALRDSSLLLRAMLDKLEGKDNLYEEIGNLCSEQLITLRHRGAFSTVAQTFTACCQSLSKLPSERASAMRARWYQSATKQVADQSTRLTRRSAGLPATMACILDPGDSPSVSDFINLFTEIAIRPPPSTQISDESPQEPSLPQVHALNCLREIMTNARFRSATEGHVLRLLEISATSFGAKEWAIRNCGLMLFRACVVRLERQRSGEISAIGALPTLIGSSSDALGVAVRLLEDTDSAADGQSRLGGEQRQLQNSHSKPPEMIFAALDLIDRGHLVSSQQTGARMNDLMVKQLGHPIWAIRQQAARLYASTIKPGNELAAVSDLLALAQDVSLQNWPHGALLCCRQILRNLWSVIGLDDLQQVLSALSKLIKPMRDLTSNQMVSPIVRTEFIEICNDALITGYWNGNCEPLLLKGFLFSSPASGETEGSFRRATALNSSLEFLMDGVTAATTLCALLRAQAAADTDAAKYLLERMNELSWPVKSPIWSHLLCSLIESELAEDVLAQTMMMLLASLCPRSQNISPDLLARTTTLVNNVTASSRDLFNAKLKLQGFLFGRAHQRNDPVEWKAIGAAITKWISALKLAGRDEVEETTRLSAATSISAYLSFYENEPLLGSADTEEDLDILIVLYDLVRDDDEDIREHASQTVFSLLSSEAAETASSLPFMPLAAGEALGGYIRRHYEKSTRLAVVACEKALGTDGDIVRYCHKNPVTTILRSVLQNSDALFAEERQNLYIDEIKELEIWCGILKELGFGHSKERMARSCCHWASEGLQALKAFLDQPDLSSTFPLGPTYNFDLLALFARVIRIAGALCSSEYISDGMSTTEADISAHQTEDLVACRAQLLERLQSLRATAERQHLHEQVLAALYWALSER